MITVPGGSDGRAAATASRTAAAVETMFAPLRLTTAREMTGMPSRRAKLSRSLKPKSTCATSRT